MRDDVRTNSKGSALSRHDFREPRRRASLIVPTRHRAHALAAPQPAPSVAHAINKAPITTAPLKTPPAPATITRPAFTQPPQQFDYDAPTQPKPFAIHKKFSHTFGSDKVLIVLASVLFLLGSAVSLNAFTSNHHVEAQAQEHVDDSVSTPSQPDQPSEAAPPTDSINDYKVATDLPRKLVIPKLNVESRVMRMGVDANNQLATPKNVFDTGWYDGSSKPGSAGAVLIDGHVSGPTKGGIFVDLKRLQKGDAIQLERGDGKVFTYKVDALKDYDADKTDMAAAMMPANAGKPGLNLITCHGAFNKQTQSFAKRLIVFATQV